MNPWPALEVSPRLKHVAAVWRRRLGENYPVFKTAFLQRAAGLAASYPCPSDCGCAHEVVAEGATGYVAVCRCERWSCDALALNAEHLALWELSWTRLGRALCGALELEARRGEIGLPNTRQIGAWSAAAVPALLTIQTGPESLRRVIAELCARLERPFILWAPSNRHLTAASLELLAHARAGFFDLESHVALNAAGALQARRAPGAIFARFTPEPAETDRSVVERAFALVQALDSDQPLRKPSVAAAFSHYCLEGLSVSRIARKFGCSRGTVLNRLELIRRRTGTDPDRFRKLSAHFVGIEGQLSDSRARSIYRKGAIYGDRAVED